jgi:hypothetical protein
MGNWSYYATKLATSPKDQVRLLIKDTTSTNQLMQDEEINFFLTLRSSVWGAAAECCFALAAQWSQSVDQGVGTAKASFSQAAKAYKALGAVFNARAAAMGSGMPYAGGLSIADMLNQTSNDDRPGPQFALGMTDNLLPVPPAGGETLAQSSEID